MFAETFNRQSLLLRGRDYFSAFPLQHCLGILVCCWLVLTSQAQTLSVSYGEKGIQSISFGTTSLENVATNPSDAFHIWHMRCTDLQGSLISDLRCGWGEQNLGEAWDLASKTETYKYSWGSVATQFVQSGNNLDVIVTEVNNADSGLILDGEEVYPFVLHFPQEPLGFYGYTQYGITTTGPAVVAADFGTGIVTSVIPDESLALYGGWKNQGPRAYSPLMAGTSPDGLATFLPRVSSPVLPGKSFTYRVSLRFTPEGVPADAADAYSSFAKTYPSQMTWTDRRAIGTAYLASSPAWSGDATRPGGFPRNPRRYFNDAAVDITNPSGLRAFQSRMLLQAAANAKNALAMNAQGVITWDLEGEQYPQSTSYVCSPDQIAMVAPEMESLISDPTSSFRGWKLDDAYFATMSQAGIKVGLCLRPQVFTMSPTGSATQTSLDTTSSIIANLETKARYANARWGATIFYVDSTVDSNGGTLDPAIFQQIITDLPGFLFIPEESTPRYYAYSAPFYTFLFHGDLGTSNAVYKTYPKAFGANLINDVSPASLATFQPQLVQAVGGGDILMGHVDFWQANDPTLVAIYQAAGKGTNPTTGIQPRISWAPPSSITYGTSLSALQLNATANVPGTYTYSPSAGSTLPVGVAALIVTFFPADSVHYTTVTASVSLAVVKAVPSVQWPVPASIVHGTALSSVQLDARSDIEGTYRYSSIAGTTPDVGIDHLTVLFTPSDTNNYQSIISSVDLLVLATEQRKPVITWPIPALITYGTPLSGAQLDAFADTSGSFSYLPPAGTVLEPGTNLVLVHFSPNDTINYTNSTASVPITVARGTPALTWNFPAPINSGSPLSQSQLNATANVPGTLSYKPGYGTILSPGVTTLQVTFAPNDAGHYTTQTATVPLIVTPQLLPDSKLSITSISSASPASGTVYITGRCSLPLDAAGTFLMVDGQEIGTHRVTEGPFIFPLDTTSLSNGIHTLQLWGHDIGNNVTVSAPVAITISNGSS